MRKQHLLGLPSAAGPLAPPRISRVHPRERLYRALDRARSRRLVWLEAPPGAGKTVLVASWLRARRLRALWYTLREGDDAASVFHRLGHGARAVAGARAELPRFQPEHLPSVGAYARALFRALGRRGRAPEVIVLDDYHVVRADSLLHAALAEGIEGAPPELTLVVVSRAGPPRAFARLRGAGEVAAIPGPSLSLHRAEARAVARLHARRSPPDRVLATASGWAAGVVLLSLAGGAEAGARRSVFDYLAMEFFDRVDGDTRQVLLRTCLLPTLTAPAVLRLSEVPAAAEVLAELGRSGSFVEAISSDVPAWRLHALFRAFLEARAREAFGAPGIADLARRTAEVLLDLGDVDGAAELLVRFAAWDGLVRLAIERGPALAAAGRLEALRHWLDAIPEAVAAAAPWIAYWHGVSRFLEDPPGAVASVEHALEAFARAGDAVGTWQSWATAVDLRIRALDALQPLERRLEELDVLRARLPFPDVATEASVVGAALSAFSNVRAWDPRVGPWEERALELALAPGEPSLRMSVGSQLAFRCAYWGTDLVRARMVLEALRPVATAPFADPMHALMWQFGEANYHAHVGAAELSMAAADLGLAVARRTGIHVWDPILLAVRIYGALASEDFDAAERDLRALAAVSMKGRIAACSYQYTAANIALRHRRWREALERARTAARLAEDGGSPAARAAARVAWAEAAARGGGSGPTLAEALADTRAAGYLVGELGALLLSARAALARRDEAEAEPLLRDALALAARLGVLNSVYVSRADLSELCAFALERAIEPDLAARIVRSRRLAACPRARVLAAWPWTTRVEALGTLAIVRDGASGAPRKAPRKPLDLLRLLVQQGERGASLEWLAEALWPDAEGDLARHDLETTLYRLRQLLGDPAALVVRTGRAALDPERVFVDAWAVERLAARARSSLGRAASSPGQPAVGEP